MNSKKDKRPVPLVDIKTPLKVFGDEYKTIIGEIIDSGAYVGTPNNKYIVELEKNLQEALHSNAGVCVCNSGTTALIVALLAAGISPGDEVILPDFNFIAGVEAVVLLGAHPVLVDVDPETYLIDFDSVVNAINHKTAAVIVTDLFGQFPDYSKLLECLEGSDIVVIEDGAQSFGAYDKFGNYACDMGHIATTSFYPVKPLGALGEGGAVFSNNDELIKRARIIINHGCLEKYNHIGLGFNGRLNAIQAATVNLKLTKYFQDELSARRLIADRYMKNLPAEILPKCVISAPSWAQFTLKMPERDKFRAYLSERLIGSDVHYPKPTSKQGIYGTGKEDNKNSSFLAKHVVSIPIHPYMNLPDVDYVIEAILKYLEGYK